MLSLTSILSRTVPDENSIDEFVNTSRATRLFTKYVIKNRDAFERNNKSYQDMINAYLNILNWSRLKKRHLETILGRLPQMDHDLKNRITRLATHGSFAGMNRVPELEDPKNKTAFLDLLEVFISDCTYGVLVEGLGKFVSAAGCSLSATLTGITSSIRPKSFVVYNRISTAVLPDTECDYFNNVRNMENYQKINGIYRHIRKMTGLNLVYLYFTAQTQYAIILDKIYHDDCHEAAKSLFFLADWYWYKTGDMPRKPNEGSGVLDDLYVSILSEKFSAVLEKIPTLDPAVTFRDSRIMTMIEDGCIILQHILQTYYDDDGTLREYLIKEEDQEGVQMRHHDMFDERGLDYKGGLVNYDNLDYRGGPVYHGNIPKSHDDYLVHTSASEIAAHMTNWYARTTRHKQAWMLYRSHQLLKLHSCVLRNQFDTVLQDTTKLLRGEKCVDPGLRLALRNSQQLSEYILSNYEPKSSNSFREGFEKFFSHADGSL